MTSLAVEWATLPTAEFVAWTRLAEVRLPFPLSTGGQAFVRAPDRAEIGRRLAERKLADSPVLDATRAAFADPRLCVYAVRVTPDGNETKFVGIAGRGEEAVLVLLDPQNVSLRQIADTDLAASVVGSLPRLPELHLPSVEVPLRGLQEIDAAIASGLSPRTVRLQMAQAGFPPPLVAFREAIGDAAVTSGLLGAVAYPEPGPGRHSTRSATWREYEPGPLLEIERGSRQGEDIIRLTPFTPDALFRAAVDAISSVYE